MRHTQSGILPGDEVEHPNLTPSYIDGTIKREHTKRVTNYMLFKERAANKHKGFITQQCLHCNFNCVVVGGTEKMYERCPHGNEKNHRLVEL